MAHILVPASGGLSYSSLMQSLRSVNGISDVLRGAVARGDARAVVGLVVGPSAELYREAAGEANPATHAPLAPDAIVRLASMTKPITSVAAMMLVDEGKLGLDDPIAKYLSAAEATGGVIGIDSQGHFVSEPPATPVTVRHLLTHTSGMAYEDMNEVIARVRESAPAIPETSLLVHQPGEQWTYGPSPQLLGDIVVRIAGQPLETFFAERIFTPLGMVDTAFTVPEDKRARLVTPVERGADGLVEAVLPAPAFKSVVGDTGLYSTAADYGRFLQMLLNRGELKGKRILSEAAVAQMTANQIGGLTIGGLPADYPGTGRDGFGFGFQVTAAAEPGRRSVGSAGWFGAYNTFFWIDPAKRIAAVLLMQIRPLGDPGALRVLAEFERQVYAEL